LNKTIFNIQLKPCKQEQNLKKQQERREEEATNLDCNEP